jgi:hypothetical protein
MGVSKAGLPAFAETSAARPHWRPTRPAPIYARFSASMPALAIAPVYDNRQPPALAAVPADSHPAHKVDNEKKGQNSSKNAATDVHVTLH